MLYRQKIKKFQWVLIGSSQKYQLDALFLMAIRLVTNPLNVESSSLLMPELSLRSSSKVPSVILTSDLKMFANESKERFGNEPLRQLPDGLTSHAGKRGMVNRLAMKGIPEHIINARSGKALVIIPLLMSLNVCVLMIMYLVFIIRN